MQLYVGAAVLLVLVGAGVWLYLSGRKRAEGDAAEVIAKVKDEQLKVDQPSRGAVLDRLRRGDF